MSLSSSTRSATLALLLCVLITSPTRALAQQLGEDRPPPRPLVEREEEEEERAQERPRRRSGTDDELQWPRLRPSVSLMGHLGFIDEDFDLPGFGLWLGTNYYPWPDKYNAFWSLGIKLERNQELRHRPFAIVPTVRSGFAWLKGDPFLFKNQVFANLQIYGLLGRHIPAKQMPPFWRMGLGVISPRLVPANAMMLLWGVPLPNQLEVVFDTLPDGSQKEILLMLGIGL